MDPGPPGRLGTLPRAFPDQCQPSCQAPLRNNVVRAVPPPDCNLASQVQGHGLKPMPSPNVLIRFWSNSLTLTNSEGQKEMVRFALFCKDGNFWGRSHGPWSREGFFPLPPARAGVLTSTGEAFPIGSARLHRRVRDRWIALVYEAGSFPVKY